MTHLSIHPLREEDIPHIVDYWFGNKDSDLARMGVDKAKLGSKTELTHALLAVIHTPVDAAKFHYMIWCIDHKPIGYSALKDIVKGEIAHMHLHMWDAHYRGRGYGANLFCMTALKFYSTFNLKIILCEPCSSNPMPNKMLTKVGFKKWKTYTTTASELSLTSEVNSYIIDQNTAILFLAEHYLET